MNLKVNGNNLEDPETRFETRIYLIQSTSANHLTVMYILMTEMIIKRR